MLKDAQGNIKFPPFVINGIRHPDNIETVWSDAQLAAVGLTRQADTPPAPPAPTLQEYAAQARYTKETAGITVAGSLVATTRDSQAMISGAYAYSQRRPEKLIKFKAQSGFVTLDAATMATIATAVGDHVQACFAKEAEVLASISAGTITTTQQIDAAFAAI